MVEIGGGMAVSIGSPLDDGGARGDRHSWRREIALWLDFTRDYIREHLASLFLSLLLLAQQRRAMFFEKDIFHRKFNSRSKRVKLPRLNLYIPRNSNNNN